MNLNLRKIWTVALTEYRQFVLTKTFIILLLMSPAMIVFFVGVTIVAESSRDLSARTVVVVDRTGQLMSPLIEAAQKHNEYDIFEYENGVAGVQIEARFLPEPYDGPILEERELLVALSDRVRAGGTFAFLIIEADVFDSREGERMRYYSQNQTYSALPSWLDRTLNQAIRNIKLKEAGIDPEEVRKMTSRTDLDRFSLAEFNERGEMVEPEKDNPIVTFLLPMGAMMLLFFCANMSSPIMLNTVMEEKMNKIVEVLLASVTPLELMAGKLAGSVGVSLTLGFVYLIPGFIVLFWRGFGDDLPVALIPWFPVFLILTLLCLGSLWAAIGAACSELKDTQNFAGFAVLFLMLPFFIAIAILESPHTPFASWASILPMFYPFLMTIRLCTEPGPEAWQLWIGLLINILFTTFMVWSGAKIFRRGVLAQGKTPTIIGLISWLRENDKAEVANLDPGSRGP